jgi:CBS domain-containing protein
VLRTGRRCFVVTENDRVSGLITTHELKQIDRGDWSQRSVQSAMRPLGQMRAVTPDMPAIKALELITREDLNQLPVISNGRLQGLFSRGRVLSFLRTQAELHERAA